MKTIDVSPINPIVKMDSLFYLGITIQQILPWVWLKSPYDFPLDEISWGFNMNG